MTTTKKVDKMVIWLAAYEAAHELRIEAETRNSEEQQAIIEPLFAKAFSALTAEGTTYAVSWKLDNQEEIRAFEEANGIEEICDKIARKNSARIDGLLKSEKEAEINLCNAALDILEVDARGMLTAEQMKAMREKVNASGWTRERQKMREYIINFATKAKQSA